MQTNTKTNKPARSRSTHDIAAMIARMMDALGQRAQDGDPADLAELLGLAAALDTVTRRTVDHMRNHQEFTWNTIAQAAGTSRQAAQQRWGR